MTTEVVFNRLSIAVQDLEKAKRFASQALRHRIDTIEHEALLFAAIVSHVRPFSQNEKGKAPQASACLRLADFTNLTDQEIQLHRRYVNLRNKALAHSEYEMNPTSLDGSTKIVSSRPFSLAAQDIDASALCAISTKFLEECHKKRGDYVSRLQDGSEE